MLIFMDKMLAYTSQKSLKSCTILVKFWSGENTEAIQVSGKYLVVAYRGAVDSTEALSLFLLLLLDDN